VAKKKYYAVRKGAQTGVFDSWDICKLFVDGFPGAEYKSFSTKKEAVEYLGGQESSEPSEDIPVCRENCAIAFVDGSFDAESGRYGYGCIVLLPDGSRNEFSGSNDDENARSSRNVAGELAATMTAVRFVAQQGLREIDVYHDYTGIAKWYLKEWKAESYVAKKYVDFMEKYRPLMKISFIKVAAHTGNTLNEAVDELAKKALGLI